MSDFYKLPYPQNSLKWKDLMALRNKRLKDIFSGGLITPNFRYVEFYAHDGTPIPLRAVPGIKNLCRDYLEPLRKKFGPAFVLSGYRHYEYNLSIGGVFNSQHDWDQQPGSVAADLRFKTGSPAQWGAEAKRIRLKLGKGGGVGIYTRLGFVHVDNRTYIADWKGN